MLLTKCGGIGSISGRLNVSVSYFHVLDMGRGHRKEKNIGAERYKTLG